MAYFSTSFSNYSKWVPDFCFDNNDLNFYFKVFFFNLNMKCSFCFIDLIRDNLC